MRGHSSLLVFLVSCLVCCNFEFAQAKIQNGDLVSNSEWSFLGYFCYSTAGPGLLNFTGWSENDKGLVIAFYDDQADSWPSVYPRRHELSCQELLNKSKSVINVVTDQTTQIDFIDKIRPHYWYVAVAKCGGKIDLQYKLEWLNYGGVWDRQLSFDEQGLAQTYLFFWLLFLFATLVHIKGTWDLHRSGQFHPIVKLLSASIVLETFALMFLFTHYASYMHNGVGAPGAKGFGQVLDMLSQLTFMFLLILLAKGWAITRTEVTQQKVLTIAVSVFLLAYITMFVWESAGVDPASGAYIYHSAPGVILLILRGSALLWFGWCLRESYMEESDPVKKRFYKYFGAGYALWFYSLIFAVIIGAMFGLGGIPYRLKFLTGFYTSANTLAFSGLAFLLWPTRARDYFQITRQDLLLGKNSSPYEAL